MLMHDAQAAVIMPLEDMRDPGILQMLAGPTPARRSSLFYLTSKIDITGR